MEDNVKHYTRYLFLLLLSMFAMTACGPEEEPTAPEEIVATELRLVGGNDSSPIEEEILRRFAEAHPDLKIVRERWGGWPGQYLNDDNPPDLMAIGTGEWLFEAIQEGLVADVTGVWEETELAANYPDSLRALTEQGGKQYFLPTGYGWYAIYYNREVFDQYAIQPPQTWDQLLSVADTLLANGVIPFALPNQDMWTASLWFDYLNLRLNGADFHQALLRGEIPYTDDRLQDVFFTWQFLIDQDYFTSDIGVNSSLDTIAAVIRGDREMPLTHEKAAMALASADMIDDLPVVFQNELDFFRFPTLNAEIPNGEIVVAGGFIVPDRAAHRLEAMTFLTFITSPVAQTIEAQFSGPEDSYVPVHVAAVDELPAEARQGLAIIEAAESTSSPYVWASPDEMRSAMNTRLQSWLRKARSGEGDVDELLSRLEEARLKALGQGAFGG